MSVTLGQNKGGADVVMQGETPGEGSKESGKSAARPAVGAGGTINMS